MRGDRMVVRHGLIVFSSQDQHPAFQLGQLLGQGPQVVVQHHLQHALHMRGGLHQQLVASRILGCQVRAGAAQNFAYKHFLLHGFGKQPGRQGVE